jgi:hypothetical protein
MTTVRHAACHVQESPDFRSVPIGGWVRAYFDHQWSDLKRGVAEFSCLSGVPPYGCLPMTQSRHSALETPYSLPCSTRTLGLLRKRRRTEVPA